MPALPVLTVYTVPNCFNCAAVKNLLSEAGIPFREVDISRIPNSREALALLSGVRSAPQVFLGSRFLGQVAEVRYLVRSGKLAELLAEAGDEPHGRAGGEAPRGS